jgi:D-alanine-D-alanine ligase
MEAAMNDSGLTQEDKPPSSRLEEPPGTSPAHPQWLVGVIANIKGETPLPLDGPADAGAEYDRSDTIQAIRAAIESDGHNTVFLPADANLPFALRDIRPDICFNIAEGLGGDGREAHAPATLEMLGIPYTASRVTANAISLDKTLTKHIWRDRHLPVAPFQEFASADEPLSTSLRYPLFVKPAREGTGMGISLEAVVHNRSELRQRVAWVIETYRQPALVEAFLPGREFTVGVLGGPSAAAMSRKPYLYGPDSFHHFPVLEIESHNSVTPGVYGNAAKSKYFTDPGVPGFICPAHIEPALEGHLSLLARQAHQAIGALDVSRVDFRLDAEGKPCLLEINTLPGLTPGFSDLCVIAEAEGLSYNDLVLEILYLAAGRWGLLSPAVSLPAALKVDPLRVMRRERVSKNGAYGRRVTL